MAADNRTGQYSVVATLATNYKPSWMPEEDAIRVASYQLYDILYWNDVGDIKLTLRGDEEFPIYIPSARRIVNTFARYVARDVRMDITGSDSTVIETCRTSLQNLFRRERFWTKFHHEKKMGSVRGDWVIMISGDPGKAEGSRLSLSMVHPSRYFALTNPEDDTDRWGAQIMEELHIGDKDYIKVQTWLKPEHPEHLNYQQPQPGVTIDTSTTPIQYSQVVYELDNFQDPQRRKAFRIDVAPVLLPGIFALPLYHIRTNPDSESKYGTSDLRGIERIFLAINQTATDQDVSLAMAGLGMFVADSSPVDPQTGEASDWIIGPKRVVEVPTDGKFDRVSGVASVEPTIGHMEWVQKQAQSLFGINEVALGEADVAVAESGIALALRTAPLHDAAGDRDGEIGDALNQFFYDLVTMWFPVYERQQFGDCVVLAHFPPKLPVDVDAEVTRLETMFEGGVISKEYYWSKLKQLPPYSDLDPVLMQQQLDAGGGFAGDTGGDPTGDRLAAEADGASPDVGDTGAE